jgi:hypothetical protein
MSMLLLFMILPFVKLYYPNWDTNNVLSPMHFVKDLCVCVCVYIHTVKVMVSDTSIITVWPDIIISQILDLSLNILSGFPFCNCFSLFINTYITQFTDLHTPWSRVLFEKLTGSHLVKKFLAFHGTRRFITAFTSAHHLSLSWSRSIQSMPPVPLSEDPF